MFALCFKTCERSTTSLFLESPRVKDEMSSPFAEALGLSTRVIEPIRVTFVFLLALLEVEVAAEELFRGCICPLRDEGVNLYTVSHWLRGCLPR